MTAPHDAPDAERVKVRAYALGLVIGATAGVFIGPWIALSVGLIWAAWEAFWAFSDRWERRRDAS